MRLKERETLGKNISYKGHEQKTAAGVTASAIAAYMESDMVDWLDIY